MTFAFRNLFHNFLSLVRACDVSCECLIFEVHAVSVVRKVASPLLYIFQREWF